jgi:Icc-related predicted phosphoesterase
MRLLALADCPPHADPLELARQAHVDAVVCLGDLDPAWIESLDRVKVPKLGVYGNHDDDYMEAFGIENLHLKRESLHGSSFCGFEGCVRYKPSGERQYTQKQAEKLAARLPAADVLLCHCPPYGVNDDPEDPAHIGFHALREWVDVHHPKVILHGHTHPIPGMVMKRLDGTRVVYVKGAKVIDLPL